jgi:hypothetical protein
MCQSMFSLNRSAYVFASAFLMTIIFVTRVSAAGLPTYDTAMASLTGSTLYAAGMPSIDAYLRQENAVLSLVTQGQWNPAGMDALNSANPCPAGLQTSDAYLLQEEAILSKVTQGQWNMAEIISFSGPVLIVQASH